MFDIYEDLYDYLESFETNKIHADRFELWEYLSSN
jgi:hypothetical protein